ncbi:AraC family transcriptional regulator [Aeromonas hydrophila]|nr:AraC family transcriptional regulator [Aeromonas hydrophila]
MSLVFSQLLDGALHEQAPFDQIWFAQDQGVPPGFSYQVNFPRLELVFSGEYRNQIWDREQGCQEICIAPGQALYIPPNGWNKPLWTTDCSVLSLLFGKRQLGFSLVSKRQEDPDFFDVQKHSIMARAGHVNEHILAALNVLTEDPARSPTDNHLLQALLTSVRQLLAESTFERPRGPSCFTGSASISRRTFTAPSAGIRSPIASTSRPATCRTCFASRGTCVWPITSAGCASIGPSSCSRNTAFASKRWPAAVVTAM